MKTKKNGLNMDERNKLVAYKVVSVMYVLTIMAMQGIVMYRQLVLGQDIYDFEGIAVVLTVNVIFLVSALLYFGAIPVQRLKIRTVLVGYAAVVVLGGLFITLKYRILAETQLEWNELVNKGFIVAAVSGLLVLFFVIFSLLGKRRAEKELGD